MIIRYNYDVVSVNTTISSDTRFASLFLVFCDAFELNADLTSILGSIRGLLITLYLSRVQYLRSSGLIERNNRLRPNSLNLEWRLGLFTEKIL